MRPETIREGFVALVQTVEGAVYECARLVKGRSAVEALCSLRTQSGPGGAYDYRPVAVRTWPWDQVRLIVERAK